MPNTARDGREFHGPIMLPLGMDGLRLVTTKHLNMRDELSMWIITIPN
jgi:hypothetical protein